MVVPAMTKPSHHHFHFDDPLAKEKPFISTRAVDFVMPIVLGILGLAVGYFFF
ncbi:hypothetical protein MAXJ12_34169 [Mesorhizobium alhagi CCNWXJ12-2]|uniref:Uncharacterized protein n=1 Tax=Mesorhizobium alhagi CCNWXJ12-2 TaxID=1107882 RepID=H0I2X6_9HYPH|nr:hypothetical protein MAXJ12_34169 [Mesorhizobium alhagi CCNWXJ12-2]